MSGGTWSEWRTGTGHGIVVWFDADLVEGVGFSNAPGAPETIYGSLFFPGSQSVPLERNQIVCLGLEAKLLEEDYIWRWTTRVMPPEGSNASSLEFEQSTLGGAVLSPKQLHRIAADHIPQLSEEGRLRRRTSELMDGRASLEEIAHRLVAEFRKRFSSWHEALSYAGVVSQEYSLIDCSRRLALACAARFVGVCGSEFRPRRSENERALQRSVPRSTEPDTQRRIGYEDVESVEGTGN
jgi:type I protein arginine methyltransferase